MSLNLRNETPTLEDVIKLALEARLLDLHTSLPGEFVSFDPATGKASVKALLKRKIGDSVVELPLLKDIPVIFPRTKKAVIYFPIEKGDGCQIIFQERSIDQWKKAGGSQDPQDKRKHHLSDAIAVPGLFSFTEKLSLTNFDYKSIVIQNENTRIRLKPDGKVKILNKLTNAELLKIVNDTLTDLLAEPFILNKGLFSLLQTQLLTMLDLEP